MSDNETDSGDRDVPNDTRDWRHRVVGPFLASILAGGGSSFALLSTVPVAPDRWTGAQQEKYALRIDEQIEDIHKFHMEIANSASVLRNDIKSLRRGIILSLVAMCNQLPPKETRSRILGLEHAVRKLDPAFVQREQGWSDCGSFMEHLVPTIGKD